MKLLIYERKKERKDSDVFATIIIVERSFPIFPEDTVD